MLTKTRIRAGIWEALLTGVSGEPTLEVLHLEQPLPGLTVTLAEGQQGAWALRLPIPAEVLTEGVQTFLVREVGAAEPLGHFTIITGVAMEDDLRAEIDLLRAELDMLKRAFRRHCLETAG
ncbi:MAG: hypothetical protein MUD11_05095 [Rhodobacteraceae bacterium]|nr:hypothetical protein [Paracoccaceae bacterium]